MTFGTKDATKGGRPAATWPPDSDSIYRMSSSDSKLRRTVKLYRQACQAQASMPSGYYYSNRQLLRQLWSRAFDALLFALAWPIRATRTFVLRRDMARMRKAWSALPAIDVAIDRDAKDSDARYRRMVALAREHRVTGRLCELPFYHEAEQ